MLGKHVAECVRTVVLLKGVGEVGVASWVVVGVASWVVVGVASWCVYCDVAVFECFVVCACVYAFF